MGEVWACSLSGAGRIGRANGLPPAAEMTALARSAIGGLALRPAHWLLVLRIATLVALAASAALLVDYVAVNPTFCGSGGCASVRQSGFGYVPLPGGVLLPLPVLGLMAYS